MKSLNFSLQSGSALVFWNAALEMALWGFIFTLCTTSISKILTLWPKAGFFFFSSFFFSFCLPLKWTKPGIQESSCALSASDIVGKPKGGELVFKRSASKWKSCPTEGFREWGPRPPLTHSTRSRTVGSYSSCALGHSSHRKDGCWHSSDLTSAVLFSPPQRLHRGERISQSLCKWSCH